MSYLDLKLKNKLNELKLTTVQLLNTVKSYTTNHNHDDSYYTKAIADSTFAVSGHNHDASYYTKVIADATFAAIDHEHESPPHNHDERYYTETESDAKYSLNSHNHDADYADISHNHNGVYSLVSHNHDGVYSLTSHNHDASYSALGHNHDASYSALGHNHDANYAALSHTHTTIDEDRYSPIAWHGEAGFTFMGTLAHSCLGVALSDTSAAIYVAFFNNGTTRTFRIRMYYLSTNTNTGKTAAGNHYVSKMANGDTFSSFVINNVAMNLTLGTGNHIYSVTSSTFSVEHEHWIGFTWNKTDNAGGATGNIYIYSVHLEVV